MKHAITNLALSIVMGYCVSDIWKAGLPVQACLVFGAYLASMANTLYWRK
jgi:hypothetical protein